MTRLLLTRATKKVKDLFWFLGIINVIGMKIAKSFPAKNIPKLLNFPKKVHTPTTLVMYLAKTTCGILTALGAFFRNWQTNFLKMCNYCNYGRIRSHSVFWDLGSWVQYNRNLHDSINFSW